MEKERSLGTNFVMGRKETIKEKTSLKSLYDELEGSWRVAKEGKNSPKKTHKKIVACEK